MFNFKKKCHNCQQEENQEIKDCKDKHCCCKNKEEGQEKNHECSCQKHEHKHCCNKENKD